MKRLRGVMVLGLAVGVGVVASFAVSRYLENQSRFLDRTQGAQSNLVTMVVAAQPIPLAASIERQHLKVVQVPPDAAPKTSFRSVEDVIGRVSQMNIFDEEPILEGKLVATGLGGGLQSVIPEGQRAITVRANDVIGVAGFLSPGDFVDVIATMMEQSRGAMVTKTVLQKIKVLSVGQQMEPGKDGKPKAVSTVTLLVSPDEAERLVLATSQGQIQLVMRSAVDLSEKTTRGSSPENLLGKPASPKPISAPPRTEAEPQKSVAPQTRSGQSETTIEIFRGSQKEEQKFETQPETQP
ncbi:MAG: Flp pilus assembly protein CpaB [Nitrospirae bacterium]|nr:Flp pilus assembly protein CpaB [Nitrospirota bacterium]